MGIRTRERSKTIRITERKPYEYTASGMSSIVIQTGQANGNILSSGALAPNEKQMSGLQAFITGRGPNLTYRSEILLKSTLKIWKSDCESQRF